MSNLEPTSARTATLLTASASALVAALGMATALDLSAAPRVTVAGAIAAAALAAVGASRRRVLWPIGVALGITYAFAFFVDAHSGPDVVVATVGAILALLLLKPIAQTRTAAATEGALDQLDVLALVVARSIAVVGTLALVARHRGVQVLGAVALGLVVVLLFAVLARDRARARFLLRVYGNPAADRDHRVEPDTETPGFELLPPFLSGLITNAVITVSPATETYRVGGARPLVRVTQALPPMLLRLERRTRLATSLLGLILGCGALLAATPWDGHATAVEKAPRAVDAPACSEVRGYFTERLESEPGVGHAALVTHAEDPSVAEGEGVLVVVPRPRADFAHLLALADAIPCSRKLALRVEEPRYRTFDVEVLLTIEPASGAVAESEARLRELFQADARAIDNLHVQLGESDKTFASRARQALRAVPGVKFARVDVSDRSPGRPGPRDFPVLGTLTVAGR